MNQFNKLKNKMEKEEFKEEKLLEMKKEFNEEFKEEKLLKIEKELIEEKNEIDKIKKENNYSYLIILGSAQDAGVLLLLKKIPQPNCKLECCTKYKNKKLATCLGILSNGKRYLFECTPDFREQLDNFNNLLSYNFNNNNNSNSDIGIEGIFLTHCHIVKYILKVKGHYTGNFLIPLGLIHLGRESINSKNLKVYCMKKFSNFLKENGPWNQLINLNNIKLVILDEKEKIVLNDELSVIPFLVDHRYLLIKYIIHKR
jgi:pyrroloquinoline quinone biosynthesis protein B